MTEKGSILRVKKSTFKNLSLFVKTKNKNPAVFEIATSGSVDRSYLLSLQKETTKTGDTTVSMG